MKRLLPLCLCSLLPLVALAGGALLEVSYDYNYYTVRGYHVADRPMKLLVGKIRSRFYNEMTNRIDSLCSTPAGLAEYEAMQPKVFSLATIGKTPARWEKMYVEKDRSSEMMKVYDTVAGEDRYYYTEPTGSIEWSLGDSVTTIMGYECMMATADYHGRRWTAWYAPEIPLSDGPWKLHGLPGLILHASDDSGHFSFSVSGISETDREIEPVYQQELYERTDRLTLLRTKKSIDSNMGGFVTARTGHAHPDVSKMRSLQPKGKCDYIETDYDE